MDSGTFYLLGNGAVARLNPQITERINLADIVGHQDRTHILSLLLDHGVTPIGTEGDLVVATTTLDGQLHLRITDSASGTAIDMSVGLRFTDAEGERVGHVGFDRELQLTKGSLAEVVQTIAYRYGVLIGLAERIARELIVEVRVGQESRWRSIGRRLVLSVPYLYGPIVYLFGNERFALHTDA